MTIPCAQRELAAGVAADEPVRVLVLRSVDGPGGGAESVLLRTAARIDPARVRLTLCCIHRADDEAYDFDRRAAQLGLDYCGVPQHSILARGIFQQVAEIVRQRQVTIVDAQDYKAAFFAYRLARREGIFPVATLHGWSGHHWRERLLYYPVEKFLAGTFPLAIAVSGEIRDTLVRWRCRPDRVCVLPNGIDPQEFRPLAGARARVRAALGLDAADEVLGAVGRLASGKRFDLLLEAMARLLPQRPRLRLVVVGEGSLKAKLQQQAERLGIAPRCHWLGHRTDVRELYQGFDVFVQSSDHEGSPTVVVEAMALAVPVVATRVGGTAELLEHNVHGLLVPRRDPAALAAAIAQTLADPPATAGRVAAARARVENELSFSARTRRLEDLYRGLAARHFAARRRP